MQFGETNKIVVGVVIILNFNQVNHFFVHLSTAHHRPLDGNNHYDATHQYKIRNSNRKSTTTLNNDDLPSLVQNDNKLQKESL